MVNAIYVTTSRSMMSLYAKGIWPAVVTVVAGAMGEVGDEARASIGYN